MTKNQIYDVTIHMIVKNEDVFVGYALASVLPYVKAVIIYDTGSTDGTISSIKYQVTSIKKSYPDIDIKFEEHQVRNPQEIGQLRYKQLQETKTDWFMLLDGDEIWPKEQLLKLLQLTKDLPKDIYAIVNRTRNCAGDVWHYLPQQLGKYSFFGRIGHYNIRLMRKKDYDLSGVYPNEAYILDNKPINEQQDFLAFCDAWYLHTTHLPRSSSEASVEGRRKAVYSLGIPLSAEDLPEVMRNTNWPKRSWDYTIKAGLYDLLRKLK